MHAQTAKITSRTATIATLIATGLASGTAARAATPQDVPVACSAAALTAAVSSAGDDAAVTLAPRCTYRLTTALPGLGNDELTIVGQGATLQRSTAPGTPKFALIHWGGGDLTVSDLNFRNGVPAIDFEAAGQLTVNGGLFSGNKGAGAITDMGPQSGPVVNGATFAGNTTDASGGAIYDNADAGGATVTNSTFYRNTAAGFGGAIADTAQGPSMFSHDVIYDNSADGGGGGIGAGDTSIENCDIFGNHAGTGGGLAIVPEFGATVTGTSIWGNSAENGGGVYDDEAANQFILPFTNDKITGNYASADGGGIYNQAGAFPAGFLNLAHTRISSNGAGSLGGGIYNGGAVAAADTTISRNIARGGGGIYQGINIDGYGVTLTSSAVLRNTPDNCEPPGTIPDCHGWQHWRPPGGTVH